MDAVIEMFTGESSPNPRSRPIAPASNASFRGVGLIGDEGVGAVPMTWAPTDCCSVAATLS